MSQQTSQPFELDVRVIPPRDKHPTIFRTFDALPSGESFILVNDHDPRPLRYQLAAARPNAFEWTARISTTATRPARALPRKLHPMQTNAERLA